MTIEYDVMTPLQDYLIRYGVPGSTYSLTATLDNTTTQFKVFIKDSSKDLLIGIAARNSVGHSQFTYTGIAAGIVTLFFFCSIHQFGRASS